MSKFSKKVMVLAVAALWGAGAALAAKYEGLGRPATPAEIKAWDIDVRPDFVGLPAGKGTAEQGEQIWLQKCAMCHGDFAESNQVFTPLVGGTTQEDIKTGRVKALQEWFGATAHHPHEGAHRLYPLGLHPSGNAVDESKVAII